MLRVMYVRYEALYLKWGCVLVFKNYRLLCMVEANVQLLKFEPVTTACLQQARAQVYLAQGQMIGSPTNKRALS